MGALGEFGGGSVGEGGAGVGRSSNGAWLYYTLPRLSNVSTEWSSRCPLDPSQRHPQHILGAFEVIPSRRSSSINADGFIVILPKHP